MTFPNLLYEKIFVYCKMSGENRVKWLTLCKREERENNDKNNVPNFALKFLHFFPYSSTVGSCLVVGNRILFKLVNRDNNFYF